MIRPDVWASHLTAYLERAGIVGTLLPRGVDGLGDRYQPHKIGLAYGWRGAEGAATRVRFKIRRSPDTTDLNEVHGAWSIATKVDADGWGNDWELVTLSREGKGLSNSSEELRLPNRFKLRISVADAPEEDGTLRREIILENLREQGGILFAIRIHQVNVPELVRVRPWGIDDDIYYRASGLIGTRDGNDLHFQPFAFLPEPSRRPRLGPRLEIAVEENLISQQLAELLRRRDATHAFEFQRDAWREINAELSSGAPQPLLLSVGTAAGKTEAFLFPLLKRLAEDKPYVGVQGIFVYPTKALCADQARRFFSYLHVLNRGKRHPIAIGVADADTPYTKANLAEQERSGDFRSPFTACPQCESGRIRFVTSETGESLSAPTCASCAEQFTWLRVDRQSFSGQPPHLLLTNPDMLHRSISDDFCWMRQTWFGREFHLCKNCGQVTASTHKTLARQRPCQCGAPFDEPLSTAPQMIVFDEAHLLKGLFGSQIALLVARLKAIALRHGHRPLFVAVSATIGEPEAFAEQLFGAQVRIILGEEDRDPQKTPTRFHLFVMPVQVTVLNAIGHVLTGLLHADLLHGEENRILVFSDVKKTVYQLESTLPEFFGGLAPDVIGRSPPRTESHTGDLAAGERRRIEREFDERKIRVLLATQTLEVGVDFNELQIEVQAGATYSYNDYIQRVGRAGRRGVPAFVVCVLRPHVPLDYYYFEHCRELVQFTPETVEAIPIRSDNPFLIERHAPAAIQDWLVHREPGAKLVWSANDAITRLRNERAAIVDYVRSCFLRPDSWDADLIEQSIDRAIGQVRAKLEAGTGYSTLERLKGLIELSIRASDVSVPIQSDDYDAHREISLSDVGAEATAEEEAQDDEPPPPEQGTS